jgi:threonylcarbamoyladenosine tRNA methylthiotransferase MtaB
MAPDEILAIPGVDLVVGTQHRDQIVEMVESVQEAKTPAKYVSSVRSQREFEELDVPEFQGHTRAFLKIQEGCNNFCTFCIIPYSRGFIRSRKPENVLKQAEKLVAAGYHEIVLSGIHTGGYGDDMEGYALSDLLLDLEKVEGLRRIRISSIEASEIDDKMIDVLTRSEKVVRHLHIPLQAGSNAVLDRMNRKYTVEDFAEKLVQLRKALPDLAITSDVIVGFPGETDEQFADTYNFVKDQQFAELHVFPYSKRKNTPAAKYTDQVPEAVKDARVSKLIELSNELQAAYAARFEGQILEVIPEEINENGLLEGYSDNYIKIAFRGSPDLLGQIVAIRLDEAHPGAAIGTFLQQITYKPAELMEDHSTGLIQLDMVNA